MARLRAELPVAGRCDGSKRASRDLAPRMPAQVTRTRRLLPAAEGFQEVPQGLGSEATG